MAEDKVLKAEAEKEIFENHPSGLWLTVSSALGLKSIKRIIHLSR